MQPTENTSKRVSRFDFPEEEILQNRKIYTEYYDEDYVEALVEGVINPLAKYWFRTKFVGFDSPPQKNNPDSPLIFVTNHSGMAFPWDAIMFNQGYSKKLGYGENVLRSLSAPMLLAYRYMNPFMVENLWKRAGCMDATYKNFDTVMQFPKNNILLYPEGVAGIAKGFNNRYQLQQIKTSLVRIAIKHKTDIISFSTVNAEYNNPYTLRWKKLNNWVNKIGIPFLPVGITTLLAVFQPWFFYFSFPAKMTYVMGSRIKAYELTDKPYEEISHGEFKKISRKVKKIMQEELNEAVKKYGKKPYKFGELFKVQLKNIRHFHKFFFPFWILNIHEFDYQYLKSKKKGEKLKYKDGFWRMLSILFKRPITIAFYVPVLGWIPILYKTFSDHKKLMKTQEKNRR